jgi:trigger factor
MVLMDEKVEKVKTVVAAPAASQRELDIEVSPDEAAREFDKVLDDYASRAKLDGFRRGKAPRDMVKRRFLNEIRESVIESLAPRVLRESLRAENINPVSTPLIREVRFKEGEPLKFKAVVEIIPEFDLPSYKKIKVKKTEVKVEDAEVERSLEDLRQKSAEYAPIEDRGVADGDYVLIEWKGRDLKTKRFLPTEKILVLAGHPDNEKNLNENLTGVRPQETRRFVISYAPDHSQKKLAGREIEYEIRVISIKEKKVPEMTDEWAKDLGEFDNLAGLRDKVRRELEKAKEEGARREAGEEIVRTLAEGVSLDLPESLVEAEAQSLLRNWAASLRADLPAPQIEELKLRAKDQAKQSLKRGLILKKIADRERIAVTDDDVEEEIKEMAKRNKIPLAQLVARINEEGRRDDIRTALLSRKTIDFLLENAVSY